MVTVLFHFTDFDPMYGLGGEKNYIKEWIYNAMVLGADKVIMVDITELKSGKHYRHASSDIQYEYFESLLDVKNTYSQTEFNWVFLESKDIVSDVVSNIEDLETFTHPDTNVIYIFGPDFSSIDYSAYSESKWVHFKSSQNKPLYAIPSSSIVLYDRFIKLTNKNVT